DWGDGRGGDGGGWFMSHVLSLQLARERACRLRGGSNGYAFKRLALPLWNSAITGLDERIFFERLETQNAQLPPSVGGVLVHDQAFLEWAPNLNPCREVPPRTDVA